MTINSFHNSPAKYCKVAVLIPWESCWISIHVFIFKNYSQKLIALSAGGRICCDAHTVYRMSILDVREMHLNLTF